MSDEKKNAPMSSDQDHLVPEIKSIGGQELLDNEAGWVIGVRGNRLMRFPTEKHMITMANTGGGKGVSVAIPNLLTHEGSVFSIEIGGSTLNETVNFREHVLKQDIHVIDPLGATDRESAHLNLLEMLDPNSKRFFNRVKLFAQSILKSPKGTQETNPYFERTPVGLLMAVLLYVRTSPDVAEEDRHLPYVAEVLSQYPSEKWNDLMRKFTLDEGPYSVTLNKVGNYFLDKVDDNTRSIHSSVSSAFDFAENPAMAAILKDSTFSLSDLRNKKATVYVVMPEIEDYEALSTWLRLLVEQSFAACPNLGDGGKNFTHNDRILFMLDEFTQLGRLEAIDTGMQTARQKGITIWALFQDYGRLMKEYGKEIAASFMGAAAVVQVFDTGDEPTNELVSKRLGKRIVFIPSVQHGENWGKSDQRNWNDTKGTSLSEGITVQEGSSDTENWSESIAKNSYTSFSTSTNSGTSSSFNWQSGTTTTNFKSTTNSSTNHSNTTKTNTIGGARTVNSSTSNSSNKGTNEAHSEGGSKSESRGGSYSVTYQPQIIPQLDPSEVEVVLGSDNNQILFIRAKNKVMRLLDQRANFYEVPMLMRRANGPEVLDPPIMIGHLMEPKQIPFQPAMTINLVLPKIEKMVAAPLDHNIQAPLTSRKKSRRGEFGGPRSPRDYSKAKAAAEEAIGKKDLPIARQKEEETFLNAAQAIEAEGLDIAGKVEQVIGDVQKRWKNIETRATAIKEQADILLITRESLERKIGKIKEFEELLTGYRHTLIEDMEYEGTYGAATERYQTYLRYIHSLRESWTGIDVPERSEVLEDTKYGPDIPIEQVSHRIGPDISVCAVNIPHIAALPKNPRNRNVPELSVPHPASDLQKRGVKLKDGKTRTITVLDSEINKKSGMGVRIASNIPYIRKFFEGGPKLSELKQARRNLIVHIQDRTNRAVEDNLQDQKIFKQWLATDNENAAAYVTTLESYAETLQVKTQELKDAEMRMDRHWQRLEARFTALNEANRMLEARRVHIYNHMMTYEEWDKLEAQTLQIEDLRAQKELLEGPKEQEEKIILPRGTDFEAEQDLGGDERISFRRDRNEGPEPGQ